MLLPPGVPDTGEAVYAFFLGRVRDRLHVVLCFSPVGARFSRRAQQFPGLINGCTIDWCLAWPEEALTAVSSKAIDEFPMACPAPVCAARLSCACGHAVFEAGLNSHAIEIPSHCSSHTSDDSELLQRIMIVCEGHAEVAHGRAAARAVRR